MPNAHWPTTNPQGATHVGPHAPQRLTCSFPATPITITARYSHFPHLRTAPAAASATESACTPYRTCHPPTCPPHQDHGSAPGHVLLRCLAALIPAAMRRSDGGRICCNGVGGRGGGGGQPPVQSNCTMRSQKAVGVPTCEVVKGIIRRKHSAQTYRAAQGPQQQQQRHLCDCAHLIQNSQAN